MKSIEYRKRCFDNLIIGKYYNLISKKNYIYILLSKEIDIRKHSVQCDMKLFTEDGILRCGLPEKLVELELSGEINKAKEALMEAKLKYL